MTQEQLVRREPAALPARLDPQALISQAIAAGADIATMERLVALAKDLRDVQAREAWYEAMAEFQRTCPSIKKTARAKIATRSGPGYEYKYAPLDEITTVIQPVMGPLGLSIAWRTVRVDTTQVVVVCRVSHTLGHHEESGEIAMPIVAGDAGANPMQRVAIAMTYAKRYSLLGIIGMAPEDDDDGADPDSAEDAALAAPASVTSAAAITEGQVRKFWAIARGTKPVGWTDEQIRARWAHVHEIPAGEYEAALQTLKAGPPK